MTTIFWSDFPVDEEDRRLAVIEGSFKPISQNIEVALKKDYTVKFHDRLRVVADSNQHVVIVIWGPQGSGKSFVMMDIIQRFLSYHKPPRELMVRDCHFSRTDALEAVEEMPDGQKGIVFLDEQTKTFGTGSGAEQKALLNIEETVRAEGISFFHASPNQTYHVAHFHLKTWQMGSEKRWDWELIKTDPKKYLPLFWKYTRSLVYSANMRMLGYIVTKTPKNPQFLEKYEEKKIKAIRETRRQGGNRRAMYRQKKAMKLLGNEDFIKKFMIAPNAALKRHFCEVFLSAATITKEEMGIISGLVEIELQTNPKFQAYSEKPPKTPIKKKKPQKKSKSG